MDGLRIGVAGPAFKVGPASTGAQAKDPFYDALSDGETLTFPIIHSWRGFPIIFFG